MKLAKTLNSLNDAMAAMRENKVRDAFNELNYARKQLKHPETPYEETVKAEISAAVEFLRVQRLREGKDQIEHTQRNVLVYVTRQQQNCGVR